MKLLNIFSFVPVYWF